MNILLIELDYHPEVLRDTCLLLSHSTHNITLFTTKKIWNKTNLSINELDDHFQLIFFDGSGKLFNILKFHRPILEQQDVIFFNTMASHFKEYNQFDWPCPILVRIHNSNTFFGTPFSQYNPKASFYQIWKDWSHIFRKTILQLDWFYRKKMLSKVQGLVFHNQIMKEYAINVFHLPKNKCHVVPMTFSQFTDKSQEIKDYFQMTITGKVDKRTRNYEEVFAAFESIIVHFPKPVTLHILGDSDSVYGRRIEKLFKRIESDLFKVVFYKNYVSQNEFLNVMQYTHLLIAPFPHVTRHTIYDEIYGLSKISGSVCDAIKFQKPCLIPSYYNIDPSLNKLIIHYTGQNDLAAKMLQLIINHGKTDRQPISITKEYSKNKVLQAYNNACIETLTSNSILYFCVLAISYIS
ncbi:MAG TPA: hypothetical protein PKC30_12420 [Saprospiraceae bacterium]|nr:hypothetical protein [Saprospiraceae bacterium]